VPLSTSIDYVNRCDQIKLTKDGSVLLKEMVRISQPNRMTMTNFGPANSEPHRRTCSSRERSIGMLNRHRS
jgi:hypothetical protein